VLHGYIVDFLALAARLVVEVDGSHHARGRGSDRRRDRALAAVGFRVLRVPAATVLQRSGVTLTLIAQALAG
jgi:very-short-patch-repair endonuclease